MTHPPGEWHPHQPSSAISLVCHTHHFSGSLETEPHGGMQEGRGFWDGKVCPSSSGCLNPLQNTALPASLASIQTGMTREGAVAESSSPKAGTPSAVTTVNCNAPAQVQRLSFESVKQLTYVLSRGRIYRKGPMEVEPEPFLLPGVRAESTLWGLRWGGCGTQGEKE